MFQMRKDERIRMYRLIYNNLRITSLEAGVSKLRRLEIRFLPLDPLLVMYIFKSLKTNFTLQELILTDDSLQYCRKEIFMHLSDSLCSNQYSSLCLLDLSRNIHSFDIDEDIHMDLLDSLMKQRRQVVSELVQNVVDTGQHKYEGGKKDEQSEYGSEYESEYDSEEASQQEVESEDHSSGEHPEEVVVKRKSKGSSKRGSSGKSKERGSAESAQTDNIKQIEFKYLETLVFTTHSESIKILYLDLIDN